MSNNASSEKHLHSKDIGGDLHPKLKEMKDRLDADGFIQTNNSDITHEAFMAHCNELLKQLAEDGGIDLKELLSGEPADME